MPFSSFLDLELKTRPKRRKVNVQSKKRLRTKQEEQSVHHYIDIYENITQLTVKDFSSEKEFRKWKNWMNMKTHTEEKRDHIHRNRTVSLDYLRELAGSPSGAYDELDESDHRSTAPIDLLVQQIRSVLSEKQFRRLWMYFAEEMTLEEIGEREGISHQNISKSIGAAMKK